MKDHSYYWDTVQKPLLRPALDAHVKVDLAIIGGGLTGLNAALEARKHGLDVALIEAHQVGFGASGRNGGMLCPGYAVSPSDLGVDQESQSSLWRMAMEAMDLLHSNRSEHEIDCDWQPGYFMAAGKAGHMADLDEYLEELEGLNYSGCTLVENAAVQNYVGTTRYKGGLFDPNGGHLHPLKYTLGLKQAALKAGVQIYENSAAQSLEETSSGVLVGTKTGSLKACHVIVACNAYATGLLPKPESHILPVATLIIGTEQLDDTLAKQLTPTRACIDESYNILNYYHLSSDNRMLFGGRSNYNGKVPNNVAEAVRPRMEQVYPQLKGTKIDFAWGGQVAITRERSPHVGRGSNLVYFAQGFSGQGLALTGQVGKVISQAIVGETQGYDLFAKLPHKKFPGGKAFRMPLQVLGMMYYRLQDMLP